MLIAFDVQTYFLDTCASLFEDLHRLGYATRHVRIDWKDVHVRVIGDAHASDGAAQSTHQVDALIEAERITRVIAREGCQPQRSVFDGAGEDPFEDKWRMS